MRKKSSKFISLILLLIMIMQVIVIAIGEINGVQAEEKSYIRYETGTPGEVYANLKPGETATRGKGYKIHRIFYDVEIQMANIPECRIKEYEKSGALVSTNKNGVCAKVGSVDKHQVDKKRHVKNQYEYHTEKFYNATVYVSLLYDTDYTIKEGSANPGNLPKFYIPKNEYMSGNVNLIMHSYNPIDKDGDRYEFTITGTYKTSKDNSLSNLINNLNPTSAKVQQIIQSTQNNYYTEQSSDWEYYEPAPVVTEPQEKVINLTDEQKRLYIRTIFRRVLKRDPRGDEYDTFMGFTPREIASNTILSPEANQKNNINSLSNEEFIKCCYRFILGREADSDGLKSHTQALNNSKNKVKAIRNFIESPEFEKARTKSTKRIELNDSVTNAVYNDLTNQNIEVTKVDSKTLVVFEEAISKVTSLNISGSNVTDLTGISAFTNVTKLSAQGNSLNNISELEKMTKLTYLNLNNNNLGKNISPVWKLTNLTELYIDNTGLTDSEFANASGLKKVQKLTVNNNKLVSLNPVKNMTALKELYANNNNIESLYGINVEKLVADNQEIIEKEDVDRSIIFFDNVLANRVSARLGNMVKSRNQLNGRFVLTLSSADLAKVENLDLSATAGDSGEIRDISGLESFRNLKSLNLSNNKVTNLDKLAGCSKLETLIARNNNLTNLNAIKDVKSLTQLDASSNLIDDISGLSELKQLDTVILNNNRIGNNLSALNNLKDNLTTLAIDNNNITDLSKIGDLELVDLYASYNKIGSLKGLKQNSLSTLNLKNNSLTIDIDGEETELPDVIKRVIEKEGRTALNCSCCSIVNNKAILDSGAITGRITVKNGYAGDTVVNITNTSDVKPPKVTDVKYDLSSDKSQMRVTITTDKEIQNVLGWERAGGRNVIYKDFKYNVSNLNVVLKDYYGNETSQVVEFSSVINNKIPGLTVTYSNTMPTNQDVDVTISTTDSFYMITDPNWTISSDKKSATKKYTSNTDAYTVPTVVTDYMFNHQIRPVEVDVQVHNIDRIAPTCTVEYNITNTTKGSVVATIWSDEEIELVDNSKLLEKTSKINDAGKTIYGVSLLYNKNTNENVGVKDAAGNVSQASVSINNIDTQLDGLNSATSGVIATNQNQTVTVKANEKINLLKNAGTTMASKRRLEGFEDLLFTVATTTPVVYLAEGEESSTGSDNHITYGVTEGSAGLVDVSDVVGNTDLALSNTNHIDKQEPLLTIESRDVNSDGSVVVTLLASEELQNSELPAGWKLSEDGRRLTKTFKNNKNETVIVKDLAGNEGTLDLEIKGINTIKCVVSYQEIKDTDSVLVIITADREIKPVDGWELLEDNKSIAKAMRRNQGEIVYIEDNEGNGAEVIVSVYEDLIKEDDTQANEILPQTGKRATVAVVTGIVLALIALITIKIKKRKI